MNGRTDSQLLRDYDETGSSNMQLFSPADGSAAFGYSFGEKDDSNETE